MMSGRDDAPAAKRGRPRRLDLDRVIDAALEVGLENLTMAAVAARLGVAKAVLYNYVGSREELIQLAGARALRRHCFPDDRGQPWSVWVLEYARALFEVMTMPGQLLEAWLSGAQSAMVEIDAAEMWLHAMTRRGLTGEEALQLRRTVSHMVIGAAASMKHDRALRARGESRQAATRKAIAHRAAEETALLRQFLDVFGRELTEDGWEFGLFLLLQGISSARPALGLEARDHPFAEQRLPPK